MAEIRLGQEVRDTVTGFTGTATSRLEYLNGCVQYNVRPRVREDGKFPDGEWIDAQQLEVVGPGINKPRPVAKIATGGPMPDAPKRYGG